MISRSSLTSVIGTSKCSNPNILDIHKSKQKSRSISSRLSGSKARALDRNSFEGHKGKMTKRRSMLSKAVFTSMIPLIPFQNASAQTDDKFDVTDEAEVLVSVTGDVKSLFNEGRAKELQGNIAAAQRIYSKVTKMAPKFIYGWSSLGNTQVVIGSLSEADASYTKSIELCKKQLEEIGTDKFGVRRCDDLYLLLLNRGSVRLNNYMAREALQDLDLADQLRGKPDAIILQNRARARELNGLYSGADRDYTLAISMTSNEVAPFWLRAALVKFQLGERLGALDLLRRVEVRFPEAPEVRAAIAAFLWEKGDQEGARRKFLEIPNQARLKFSDTSPGGYVKSKIAWPPSMIDTITAVSKSVGDQ